MAFVEIDGVSGQEPAHDGCKGSGFGPEQQVDVIVEKNPGVTERSGFIEERGKPRQEPLFVQIVSENRATFHATCNDVLQQTGVVDAGSAGHRRSLPWKFNYSSASLEYTLQYAVCRLYDTELITASRACELLGGIKAQEFRQLYGDFGPYPAVTTTEDTTSTAQAVEPEK